jgi:RNA 2',3'-cyclic 3'-phosphodiesterase
MRLFIGVPLASAVTEQLAGLRKRLERPGDGLRWSSAESWHITLQFLGATTETQHACVLEHLRKLSSPGIPIRLEGLGFFDRAGVFFVGVSVSPQLARLQQMVTRATSHCGFVPEDRPYHPHITLARKKGQSAGTRELRRHLEDSGPAVPHFPSSTAREFLLYESFPSPAGSRYEIRARFPLSAN